MNVELDQTWTEPKTLKCNYIISSKKEQRGKPVSLLSLDVLGQNLGQWRLHKKGQNLGLPGYHLPGGDTEDSISLRQGWAVVKTESSCGQGLGHISVQIRPI